MLRLESMGVEFNLAYAQQVRDNIVLGSCAKLTAEMGEGCERLPNNPLFEYVVNEIVSNCAEKDAHGIEIGIHTSYDPNHDLFRLIVEDNITYSQEQLELLLANLAGDEIKRTGKIPSRTGSGQLGVYSCRKILERWGGTLSYEPNINNGITAVAQWRGRYFNNPLPIR